MTRSSPAQRHNKFMHNGVADADAILRPIAEVVTDSVGQRSFRTARICTEQRRQFGRTHRQRQRLLVLLNYAHAIERHCNVEAVPGVIFDVDSFSFQVPTADRRPSTLPILRSKTRGLTRLFFFSWPPSNRDSHFPSIFSGSHNPRQRLCRGALPIIIRI